MNTNTLIIVGAIAVAFFVFMKHSEKPAQSADPINSQSIKESADSMGLVDTANPAPSEIVSNKPYGTIAKGLAPAIPKSMLTPADKGVLKGMAIKGLPTWAQSPTMPIAKVAAPASIIPKSVVKPISTTTPPSFAPTSRHW